MQGALQQAQECLAIHSVNLRESQIAVHPEVQPWSYDRTQAQVQYSRRVVRVQEIELKAEGEAEKPWEYRFYYALGVRCIPLKGETENPEKDERFKPDLEIIAIFQARYLCKRRLDQDELSAFSKDNVGYHVWPYWREFVQASCNRIGLTSPIEVPMYFMSRR